MAKKIRFEIDGELSHDGETHDAWVEFSSAVEKAAMEYATQNDIPPSQAYEHVTGIDAELFR